MIQEYQLRVLPEIAANEQRLKEYLSEEKGLNLRNINATRILKRSIDARQRTIFVNLKIRAYINEMPEEDEYEHTVYNSVEGKPQVIVVGAGADAVDYNLISICHRGDIVVSQDYGVAAMALGKGAYAIHQSGKWYTDENIDRMLMERHLNKKARRGSSRNHIKGTKKRTNEDDERFAQSFEKLVLMAQAREGEQDGTV